MPSRLAALASTLTPVSTMTSLVRSLALVSALTVAGLGLNGCQSTRSPALKQGANASVSSESAAITIDDARAQISATTAALRNLVDRPQDTAAQYKVVLTEFAKLRDHAAKIAAAAESVRAKSDDYLADWAKQVSLIQNAELRSAALNRRGEVSAKLQAVYKSYQDVKAAYAPFEADLANIRAAVGSDLSAAGLVAVRPFVAQATAHAEPVKASMLKLAGEFRAVSAALQPGGQ
jgi:hypothetical protein